jgi:hypothetical protein
MSTPLRLTGILLAIALLGSSGMSWAQSSPFMRQGGNTPAISSTGTEAPADYAFTGVVALGNEPMVCITTVATQRSQWIKVGQTVAGIRVLDHDPETRTVLIQRAGREMTLELKKRTFDPSQLQAYQPIAAAPVAQAGLAERVPLTNEEKATEARMLVSDLLEIGIIQRKAYEKAKQERTEAQKQAAQEALKNKN